MCDSPQSLSRRDLLRGGAAMGAALVLPGCASAATRTATGDVAGSVAGTVAATTAPTTIAADAAAGSAAEALESLLAGNRRFAGGESTNPNRTLARLRELGTKQAPFAAVLACSDSRVPVEILFDQGFGDVFVSRVAGNIATSELIGSLEYATQLLGAQVVLVLGHSGCGAVSATMAGTTVPGQIGSLYPYIHPAVERVGAQGVDAVIEENVRNQVSILQRASPVIAGLKEQRRVTVAGGVFDFRTGLVTLV